MIQFKYFQEPDNFAVWSEDDVLCDVCESETKCFDASSFYGEDTLESICPECLQSGKLLTLDAFTCEGDITSLKQQLSRLHPGKSESEIDLLAGEKTDELERTTPQLVTWQGWEWPCLDGDYCRFIGFGSRQLYTKLAGKLPAMDFFIDSFYDPDAADDDLWDALPERAIRNAGESEGLGSLAYVFQSLHSSRVVTIMDAD